MSKRITVGRNSCSSSLPTDSVSIKRSKRCWFQVYQPTDGRTWLESRTRLGKCFNMHKQMLLVAGQLSSRGFGRTMPSTAMRCWEAWIERLGLARQLRSNYGVFLQPCTPYRQHNGFLLTPFGRPVHCMHASRIGLEGQVHTLYLLTRVWCQHLHPSTLLTLAIWQHFDCCLRLAIVHWQSTPATSFETSIC